MANNDMEVIMYKILNHMYECMKAGKRPRMEDICHSCQMFQIPFDEGGNWSIVKSAGIDFGDPAGWGPLCWTSLGWEVV